MPERMTKQHQLVVRVDEHMLADIEAARTCEPYDVSQGEMVRRLISEALEARRGALVANAG